MVLSAFLALPEVGIHTVRVQGGCFGSGIPDAYGSSFICEDFTYTVEVLDKGDPVRLTTPFPASVTLRSPTEPP